VFDRAQSGDGWNSGISYFTSDAQLQETFSPTVGTSSFNGQPFTAGETAYLWVYNDLSIGPGTEWALVRDGSNGPLSPNWVMPTPDDTNVNTIDWDLLQADTAIFGQVNGVIGGGNFSPIGDPGGGVAWLQTAPVPEPGSALLLLIASFLGFRRRR
jgi:hypothetical protein